MQHNEFLQSLTKMAAGNVYKKNSANRPWRESTVFQSDLSKADMARGFQPATKQEFGYSDTEPYSPGAAAPVSKQLLNLNAGSDPIVQALRNQSIVWNAKDLLQALQRFLDAVAPQSTAPQANAATSQEAASPRPQPRASSRSKAYNDLLQILQGID